MHTLSKLFIAHKLAFIITASLLLALLGVLLFTKYALAPTNEANTPIPTVTPGTITVEGEIVCLPHKGDGPYTLECAFGMVDENKKYYGLKNLDQSKLINGEITTGAKVKVQGSIEPPAKDEKYAIVGTITIQSFEVISSAASLLISQNIS